ncbi:MAG: hypothetical protein AAF555_11930 [Verrucomicrobiota bacterium]
MKPFLEPASESENQSITALEMSLLLFVLALYLVLLATGSRLSPEDGERVPVLPLPAPSSAASAP